MGDVIVKSFSTGMLLDGRGWLGVPVPVLVPVIIHTKLLSCNPKIKGIA